MDTGIVIFFAFGVILLVLGLMKPHSRINGVTVAAGATISLAVYLLLERVGTLWRFIPLALWALLLGFLFLSQGRRIIRLAPLEAALICALMVAIGSSLWWSTSPTPLQRATPVFVVIALAALLATIMIRAGRLLWASRSQTGNRTTGR